MVSLLSRLFGVAKTSKSRVAKPPRAHIGLEALEDRLTPSGAYLYGPAPTVAMSNNVLTIHGTYLADTVSVHRTATGVDVAANGFTYSFALGAFDQAYAIVFYGNEGNDSFQNNTQIRATALGGPGNDRLSGGYAIDALYGEDGNDTLISMAGWSVCFEGLYYDIVCYKGDILLGGEGDDYLLGSDASDTLHGQGGNDTLVGAGGADYLYGGIGNDFLYGGIGNDFLYGGSGLDYLYGWDGDDTLDGGDDGYADYLQGGAGRDKFQVDGFSYSNRDKPTDFNPYEDSTYGEEQPFYIISSSKLSVAK